MTIGLVSASMFSATQAVFTDSEVIGANTFAAGSLDLKVNGEDEPISVSFVGEDMIPGKTVNAGTISLSNSGSVDGILTVKVSNPVSNEISEIEPEISSGDVPGAEVDPTGYDANGGDGELWDMSTITIYFDMNGDGEMQWYEPTVWNGQHLDMTTTYRIQLDTNLWSANHGFDGVLAPGETVNLGVLAKLKTDAQLASQPQYNGLNNNMAMTDDMQFDLIIGLEQTTP